MKFRIKNKALLSEIGLLICGAAWGGGFVVTKGVMESVPPSWTLGIRFIIPALLMAVLLRGRLFRTGRRTLLVAAVSGVIQYSGLMAQMTGLTMTTAGNSAFLTAIYVVLVPFFHWGFSKRNPGTLTFFAGVLCLAGIGILALQSDFTINAGDAWELLGGVLFALNIVLISVCITGGMDAMVFTCVQFLFTALPAFIQGLLFDSVPLTGALLRDDVLLGFFYIIFINTIFAQIVHNVALGYAAPSRATLFMSTEALFGCLFGIIFLSEPFTPRFFMGAVLIGASIIISEVAKNRGLDEKQKNAV